MDRAEELLRRVFGLHAFRGFQADVIQTLAQGWDALVLMPGASAWSCNGTAIRFEDDDENVMQELVYTPRVCYLGTWGGTPELPH